MPTKVSWNKGRDREVTCLALDPDQMTSGTLKGAKR